MAAFYNEVDPFCVAWLRNLIRKGLIADGEVDSRSIVNVTPADVAGFTQCHWFAGIGLFSHALRSAGWGDDRAVWSGSCPCQPLSQAGKRLGAADERHLWPDWHWLISQCRPDRIVGEQVASPDGLLWLDLVATDLEAGGYTVGAVDFPSAGVGAPNIRNRLWWTASRLGDAGNPRLPDPEPQAAGRPGRGSQGRAVEQPSGPRDPWRELEWIACRGRNGTIWRPVESKILGVADGDPAGMGRGGAFPLAPRQAGDVGKLRAYGNAINPVVATEIITAWMECAP